MVVINLMKKFNKYFFKVLAIYLIYITIKYKKSKFVGNDLFFLLVSQLTIPFLTFDPHYIWENT